MKVLIDLTQIPLQKTGVGVYALNLINEIIKQDNKTDYVLTVQDDDSDFTVINNPKVLLIRINGRLFRCLPLRFIFEQIMLPAFVLKYKIDIVHSLHYSFPIICFSAKRIVTIHDLTFFKYPNFHIHFKRIYFKFFISISQLFVKKVLVVSESTKRDLLKFAITKKDIVKVIHLGCTNMKKEINKKDIEKVMRKYQLPEKYFLYLGVIEPRKNILNLLKAFKNIIGGDNRYCLVIAGKNGWHFKKVYKLIKKLDLEKSVIFTGYVEEIDKYSIIKGSKIFIYPSVYEGFGLPVLEAMSLGVPTIANKESSIIEFAKNGAMLVNTSHVDEISYAISTLLSDVELYNAISRRAESLSKKFTWAKTAKLTIDAYYSI